MKRFTAIVITLIASILVPLVFQGVKVTCQDDATSFSGVAWKPTVAVRRVILVNAEDSYLDSYSYLAAVPAAISYDAVTGEIYASPVLYYKPDLDSLAYLVEDWVAYCDTHGGVDEALLVNVARADVESMLPATSYVEIEAADAYDVAAKIAEATWSNAPGGRGSVALIEDSYPDPPAPASGTINDTYPDSLRGIQIATEGWNSETLPGNVTKITYDPNEPVPEYQTLNDTSVGLDFHWYFEFEAPEWAYGIEATYWYSDGMSNDMVLYMETADGRRVKFGISKNTAVGDPAGDTVSGQVAINDNFWPKVTVDPYTTNTYGGVGGAQWEYIRAPNVRPGNWSIDPWWDEKRWFGYDTAEGFLNVTLLPGHEQEIQIPAFAEDLELTMTWNDPKQNLDMVIRDASGATIGFTGPYCMAHYPSEQTMPVGPILEGYNYSYTTSGWTFPEGNPYVPVNVTYSTTRTLTIPRVGPGPLKIGVVRSGGAFPIQKAATGDVPYTINYSYKTYKSQVEADCLTNAVEASTYAAVSGIPLFYVKRGEIPQVTLDAMEALNVKHAVLFDIGEHASSAVISGVAPEIHLTDYMSAYNIVPQTTDMWDHVVMTTIHPHKAEHHREDKPTPWELAYMSQAQAVTIGDTTFDKATGASFQYYVTTNDQEGPEWLGPAALAGAVHGAAVVVVDTVPELACLASFSASEGMFLIDQQLLKSKRPYVPERFFDEKTVMGPETFEPWAAKMLESKHAYEALFNLGFDKYNATADQDIVETIIVVASLWDIGPDFDRSLWGKAVCGRFGDIMDEPADAAAYVCRNIFYPALIHQNPAIDDGTALYSFEQFTHEPNRLAEWWGKQLQISPPSYYTDALGITPGNTTGYPDVSPTDIIPGEFETLGFTSVYHTDYNEMTEALNSGALMYTLMSQGYSGSSGFAYFWDPVKNKAPFGEFTVAGMGEYYTTGWYFMNATEYWKTLNTSVSATDPWRAFETLGSVDNPDTLLWPMTWNPVPIPDGYVWGRPARPDRRGPGATEFAFGFGTTEYGFVETTVMDYTTATGARILSHYASEWPELLAHYMARNAENLDNDLENLYSTGAFLAVPGVGMSAFPTTFLRHGATFAIGDYLDHLFSILHVKYTNWASILFTRYLNDGMSIGKAFLSAIAHTGSYYVTEWAVSIDGWIIYGDPTLEPYSPASPTAEPVPAAFEGIEEPTTEGISDTVIYVTVAIIIVLIIVAAYLLIKRK